MWKSHVTGVLRRSFGRHGRARKLRFSTPEMHTLFSAHSLAYALHEEITVSMFASQIFKDTATPRLSAGHRVCRQSCYSLFLPIPSSSYKRKQAKQAKTEEDQGGWFWNRILHLSHHDVALFIDNDGYI